MPNEKPKTDWSFIEKRKNEKTSKKEAADWSFIDGKKQEEEPKKKKEESETIAPEAGMATKFEIIKQLEYEQAKKAAEKYILEHPILKEDPAERLRHADVELRKRFGIK